MPAIQVLSDYDCLRATTLCSPRPSGHRSSDWLLDCWRVARAQPLHRCGDSDVAIGRAGQPALDL